VTGAQVGSIIGAAGLVPLLVTSDRRLRLAGLAAWIAGYVVLMADLLHAPIATLRVDATDRPLLAVAGVIVLAAATAVGALVALRWPIAVLLAAVATAPARIPVHTAGEDAKLLLPLYGVIAVMVAVMGIELVLGRARAPALGRIGWAAAGFVLWTAVSLLWSADEQQGGVQILFFYLPFGLLLAYLATLRPRLTDLRNALGIQVLLAIVFAGVALWQFETKHIFWNQTIIVAHQYASFFRVNSLFYDASVYARFMAVTVVLLAGLAVFRRLTIALAALIALLFAGLYLAYSQSSLLALAAGATMLGTFTWPRRLVVAIVAVAVVIGVTGLGLALRGSAAHDVTSGRTTLIDYGWEVTKRHPLEGAGVGGFAREAVVDTTHPGRRAKKAASHTTPVTVIAELGPIGFALYAGLLAAIALRALRASTDRLPRLTLLTALAAIATSSLFYNAYFEDPATWILTALIATVTLAPRPRAEAAA
jgi:O-antigen ligase/polysaccharide polymerase Wzy-like membrane protein